MTISSPDNTPNTTIGTAEVQFGTNGAAAGTIGSFGTVTGNVTASAATAGAPATLALTTNFGSGNAAYFAEPRQFRPGQRRDAVRRQRATACAT